MKTNQFFKQKIKVLVVLLSIGLVQCSSEKKEEKDSRPSFYQQLHDIENLNITLKTDYDQLLISKSKEGDIYQNAELVVASGETDKFSTKIEVRPRGVTRKSMCDYPPLMIKIKKEEREKLGVRKTDNIKLVSFCKTEGGFSDLVSKEYLIYKLYNVLTDTSYQVKFANLTIQDTLGVAVAENQIGFMIEPTDAMADRLFCTYDENDTSPIKKIHKEQYKNFVVFQYMVGNTDWNLSGRHNIRMLDCDSEKGPKPVPYDFDYSGLVNASYARPHPMLPIKKVTDRLFQFRGSVDEDFSKTYQLFKDKKEQFYAVVNDFNSLNEEVKGEMNVFLDQFFQNIESNEFMREEMMKVRKKKS